MAWRRNANHDRYSSDETTANYRVHQKHADSVSDTLWVAAGRSGSTWKQLKTDLTLLAGAHEHEDVLEAFASALKLLGSKLLPTLGKEPLRNFVKARPESQEIALCFQQWLEVS